MPLLSSCPLSYCKQSYPAYVDLQSDPDIPDAPTGAAPGANLVPYFNEEGAKAKPHSLQEIPFLCNFWPDGEFQSPVSLQELQDAHNLATNWVLDTIRNVGSTRAFPWQKGGIHNHGKFTLSSIHPADGLLAFMEYTPKYTTSGICTVFHEAVGGRAMARRCL
ncbi:hypothetical protein K438DRAFT_1784995 [Mycena galopus ATCC 62051]|nr:hypothetical protein K438DRAFT_1784995 [Mycena galopus ATCC 62051]